MVIGFAETSFPQLFRSSKHIYNVFLYRMRLLQMVLACLVRTVLGSPDGAPTASCQYMLPGHINTNSRFGRHPFPIQHQNVADSRYIINATWDKQGEYVHVLITGSALRGFLIQARETELGPAVGKFKILPKESKYQICNGLNSMTMFDPEASVTHRNSSIKEDLLFVWKPPLHGKGNITFYATIAESHDVFWLKLPSNTIDLSVTNRGSSITTCLLLNLVFLNLILTIIFTTLST